MQYRIYKLCFCWDWKIIMFNHVWHHCAHCTIFRSYSDYIADKTNGVNPKCNLFIEIYCPNSSLHLNNTKRSSTRSWFFRSNYKQFSFLWRGYIFALNSRVLLNNKMFNILLNLTWHNIIVVDCFLFLSTRVQHFFNEISHFYSKMNKIIHKQFSRNRTQRTFRN